MSLLYAHLTSRTLRGRLSSTAEKDSFLLVRGKVAAGRHRGPLPAPLPPPLEAATPKPAHPPPRYAHTSPDSEMELITLRISVFQGGSTILK